MTARSFLITAALVMAASPAAAQGPPTFRAGVDVLTLDASVVDAEGRPVPDLRADEFTAVVDGAPRRVVSVRFLDAEVAAGVSGAAGAAIAGFVRNSGASGRIVVFVVDRDSISPGNERALLASAGSLLDALGPGDAAGAVALPDGTIDLTRDHQRVRTALVRMTGSRPVQPFTWRDRQMTWEEALAYERRDARVIAEVVERECYNIPAAGGLTNRCPDQLKDSATELLMTGRAQVQRTLAGLTSIVSQLGALRGTKQVVLLSGGLPHSFDLQAEYNRFLRAATGAGIVVHAIHTDQFDSDPANRKIVSSVFGGREHATGLGAISAGTGGGFFTGVGTAAGVFDRLSSELRSFYQVGVETVAGDQPGALKRIELSVQRPNVKVRAVRGAAIPGGLLAGGGDRLGLLLRQPTDVTDLPLAVSAYTMRGDEAETLRVVIAAEVGDARMTAPAEWGFVVFTDGNPVATSRQRFDSPEAGPRAGAMSAKLVPGQYRMRVAAVDADGRPGVVDLPLAVGLRAGGSLQFSDLMLGVADASGRVQARSTVPQGRTLAGLFELMSADPALLDRARAVIEIAAVGSAEPLKRFVMGARPGAAATIQLHQVQIATAGLAAGRYVASVTPLVDDQPAGRVSRIFEVIAPAP